MKKIISSALLLSFVAIQVAPCAMSIAYAEENVSTATPKQFKTMVRKNKKLKESNKVEYVNLEWWNVFGDDILTNYIQRAINNNYDLKAATLNVEEAYQMMKIQFANELPSLTVGGGGSLMKMPGSTSTGASFGAPIIVNYEADIFLKNHDKTKSSKKSVENARFDERAAYIAIASAVGATYLNIVNLDKTIEIQTDITNIRKKIFELTQLRNQEGLSSTADTVRANKAFVQSETNLIDMKKQRDVLLNQLCVLIGESPENAKDLQRTSHDELNYNNVIPEYISSEVIMQRPDYLKAENTVEKAGIDVRVAKKELLPSLNLLGLGLFNASDLGSLFTTKNMLLGLGGGLMAPIFTGGQRMANIRLKKATYDKILQNYYKTNLTAIQEVNDALVKVRMDKEKVDQTLKQAVLESQDYTFSRKKYNEGTISYLDLIQQKENLLYINNLVAQSKTEFMIDYIGLYKATGSKL